MVGTFSMSQALRPAIHVAARGFAIDQVFFDQTQQNADFFDDLPATARLFLDRDGTPRDVGTVFRNPDLARTYARIGSLGPAGFYRGPLARAIVDTVTRPPVGPAANHRWRPGVMTTADLAAYTAPEREPTHVDYRGYDVYGMGPPSSGGSTVGEALNILEGYDLRGRSREEVLHLFLEASRFAFADRNAYVADPDFFDVALAGLLSDGFAAQRRANITDRHRRPPGQPAKHAGHERRTGVHRLAGSGRTAAARPRIHRTPEIGAATAIEFLAGDRVLAAAEPVRRGGGSAGVEQPDR